MKLKAEEIISEFIKVITTQEQDLIHNTLLHKNLITNNVESRYLCGLASQKVQVQNSNNLTHILNFDNCPYQIKLVKLESNLKIDSFKFICSGCLNDINLGKKECGVCGGSGWGVL